MNRAPTPHKTTPPIEVRGSARQPLGMPPAQFLRDYWQKRPLLIRNAFPDFVPPIQPEDLAGPVVWLASSGSDYVNGQTIFIDGGMTVVV